MEDDQNPFDLTGKHAAVTGGFGILGSAISSALARSGASVTVLDVSDHELPSELPNQKFATFDVTILDNPSDRLTELESKFGDIDIWVNSAYPRTSDWTQTSIPKPESWRQNIDMHLSSYCLWSEFIALQMAARGEGVIVNVASIYGIIAPDPGLYEGLSMSTPSAYSAIKGGIMAHTKHLAARFGRQGVRVNAISPGGIENQQPATFTKRYNEKTMLGRMAEANEIAWPIVFLCSDASRYITGTNLIVDGGLTSL